MNAIIFLRKDHVNKDGTQGVYLRIRINRKKKEYSLKILIVPEQWDEKNLRVKKNNPFHKKYNLVIESALSKAKEIFLEYKIYQKSLSFDEFEFRFKKVENKDSFLDFVSIYIDDNKHKYAHETIRSYNSYLTKLVGYKKDLSYTEVNNTSFTDNYEKYMRTELGNTTNTVYKNLSFIRTVLTEAKKRKLIQEVIFEFSVKKLPGNREHLTTQELEKLEKLISEEMLPPYLHRVLSYFLFSCYTGLRFQDLKTLKYKHIVYKDVMDKKTKSVVQKPFIKKLINKTKNSTGLTIEIPLISKAMKLIGKGAPEDIVFFVNTNQVSNRYAKEIMQRAKIEKNITTHCARHTFATHSLTLGVPIEVVSKLLGHSDIRTTQIYAKIVDSAKVDAMDKWEEEN